MLAIVIQCKMKLHEMRDRARAHLLHHLGAMDLYSALAQPEIDGDHLICASLDDEAHHLPLTGGQRLEPLEHFNTACRSAAIFRILLESVIDAIQQILISEGFLNEFERTFLHCLHRHGNIAVTRDEDYRQHRALTIELLLNLES